jgi:hypothetical protein
MLRAAPKVPLVAPSEEEILFELSGENPGNRLFGRFDEEAVRLRLSRSGILSGLALRGYPDPRLVLDCRDPGEQRVLLFAGAATPERLLLETRLELQSFRPRKSIGPFTGASSFLMLIIHWLSLSDPDRAFTPDRPRLPGQRRPGLGILPQSLSLLHDLGRELGIDGILDVPDHYHTAFFYSRVFRFLDPDIEGKFQAMVRDLRGAPLALVSEAIALGCLFEAETSAPLRFEPAEQVLPVRGELKKYFRSGEYRRQRDQSLNSHRTTIDWNRYREVIAKMGADGKYP